MGKKFNVGVIGTGSIAQIAHLPVLASRDDVNLTAIMAKHIKNAEASQRRYGASNAVDSIDDMLKLGIDCAFVLSPKECHKDQVIRLLEEGVDVFCEKPLAMSLKDADEMVEAANRTGKMLMVGFNRRFAPVYQKAKESYAGTVPDVVIAQKNRPETEYRATLENAIHMVDLLRFFCGECVDVKAFSKFSDPYYETLTTAQLQFENGAVGVLVADRACGQWMETLEIHGTNKSVYVDSPDQVRIVDNVESHTTKMTPLAMGWAKVEDKMGFRGEDDHFFHCLNTGETPLTSGEDAFKTHVLMNQILTSAGLPNLD